MPDNYGAIFGSNREPDEGRKLTDRCDILFSPYACDHDGPQRECACGAWVCKDCGKHFERLRRERGD